MAEGIKTPIAQGVIDRISGVLSGAIKGASEAWFGPQQPLPAVAPPDVAGRQFDYPVATNLQYKPRGESGQNNISFQTLRALADPTQGGLDLVRMAIETRKDQMAAQRWLIRPRREDEENKSPLTPGEKSLVKSVRDRIAKPDGFLNFRTWQRMLIEDLLVIDAATVYLAPTAGADKRPEVMDGATIKRLIRPDGRTPMPPDPAYMQALKGLPAVYYTTDELICQPRNPRSDRFYGMSPTEQVITTVNIALRRQLSQLEYYTAGSVPDSVFGVPENWNAEQIRQFQTYWDSILSGNTEERRRARFIPGGVKPTLLKPDGLKDDYDEWLARIVCWCFSLSPGALVRDMNRATATTNANNSRMEGLEPLKLWFADLMDEVLAKALVDGASVQFAWADEEITDPEVKARVFAIAMGNKPWITADEARAEYGKQPLTPEQNAQLLPPGSVPVPQSTDGIDLGDGSQPPADVQAQALNGAQVDSLMGIINAVAAGTIPRATGVRMMQLAFSMTPEDSDAVMGEVGQGFTAPALTEQGVASPAAEIVRAAADGMAKVVNAKLRKAAPTIKPIDHDRPEMRKISGQIAKACASFFEALGKSTADAARGLQGAEGAKQVINGADYTKLRLALTPLLAKAAISGGKAGLMQVSPRRASAKIAKAGISDEDYDEMLSLVNENGVAWAEERAAELVGMHKEPDGSYTVSKVPGMAISKTTRDTINALVEKAMQEGMSNNDLADAIEESEMFSPGRSERIARTETAFADLEGNRIGWRESGLVVGRYWLTAEDEACDDCVSMTGETVGIDEEFPGGNPPRHPNCRCAELPILAEDDEEAEKVNRRSDVRAIEKACESMAKTAAALNKRLEQPLVAPKPAVVVFNRDKQGRIVSATTKPQE